MKKRLLCLLLLLSLALSLGGGAFAEGNSLLQKGDTIYMGEYTDKPDFGDSYTNPVCWLVLDPEHTNSGEPGVFVLSKYIVQRSNVRYAELLAVWPGSLAQQWCTDFLAAAFTDAERALIPTVSKSEEPLHGYALSWAANELSEEQLFFLSAQEAKDYIGPEGTPGLTAYTPDGVSVYWWFRSPHFSHPDWSGLVLQGNDIHDSPVDKSWGARPAMNLDLSRALLLLPAQGSPEIAAFSAVERPEDGAWKLLIPDETRSLTLTDAAIADGVLTLDYADAPTGANEYLSLLLRGENGEIMRWGRICRLDAAQGQASVALDSLPGYDTGEVLLFAERDGGDFYTNYASAPLSVTQLLAQKEAEKAARAAAEAEAEAAAQAAEEAAAEEQARPSPLRWVVPIALAAVLAAALVFLPKRRRGAH